MSAETLVQVGDDIWLDPSDVIRVKHWPVRKDYDGKLTTDNTVIVHKGGTATISYWPFERIQRVLGLVDKTWLHDFWEGTE